MDPGVFGSVILRAEPVPVILPPADINAASPSTRTAAAPAVTVRLCVVPGAPLMLDATDGLSFQCTHNNYDRDVPIEFGFTSEDEMCLIAGYYYLPTEAEVNGN